MSNWNPLLHQSHQVAPKDYPCIVDYTFEVTLPVKKLHLRCTESSSTQTVQENESSKLVREYYSHPDIRDEQKQLNQSYIQEQIQSLPQKEWAVHLFDSDQLFRGRWDSSFQDWKMLSEYQADEGFVGGPLPLGTWRYIIFVFSPFLSNPVIDVEIECSDEGSTPPDLIPFDLSTQMASVQSDPRWYAGELQESTTRSNGMFSVQDTVQSYQHLGYSFLSISDMDMQPLSALSKQPNLGVIRGQVLPTPYGKLNAMGVNGFLSWYKNNHPIQLHDLIYEIHSNGGLVKKLNPFRVDEIGKDLNSIPWEHIDLLQIWEGFWQQRFPEVMKAFQLWDRLLNLDIRITGVCGKGNEIEVNAQNVETLPKMLVQSKSQSENDLLNAMKLGLCYSTVEPGLDFWVESDFGGILTGEELQLPDGSVFTLRLDVNGAGERCFFRIISNDGLFCEMPVMARKDPVQMKFTDYAEPKVRWYRVELYRYGRPIDELLAFTNPVYVRGVISYK